MMMIKRSVLVLVCSIFLTGLSAQEKDFGIWYGANAEFKPLKKLEVDISTCLRTFENASRKEELYLEAGVGYKFNKYFSAGGSYRITQSLEKDDNYHTRHKWFINLKGTLPAGDFAFTVRVRFEERYRTYFENEDDKVPVSHLRTRLAAQYDIPSFPVNPYLSAEFFFPVRSNADETIDKKRFVAGFEYNITKKMGVELEYIYQRDYHPRLADMNIVSVNYFIKF